MGNPKLNGERMTYMRINRWVLTLINVFNLSWISKIKKVKEIKIAYKLWDSAHLVQPTGNGYKIDDTYKS